MAAQNKYEFKPSPLGPIPVDWEVKKLGALAIKIGSGITPTGGSQVYKKAGRPFLRSQNVGWGNLLLDDVAFIDEHIHQTFSSTEIKENDVLLNITGASIGRSALADKRIVNGNVNQHVCIIRPKPEELTPSFLNSFLLTVKGQNLIDSFQAGGNREGLNFEQIKSFPIPLPPVSEQQTISTLLKTWDKGIERINQLIIAKKQRKKWLMQQLLTGKKRLSGFKDNWSAKLTSDIADIIMGQSPDGSTYNQEGKGTPLINGPTEFNEKYPVKIQWTTSPTKMCKPDDILLCVRGSSTGSLNIADEAYCIGRGIAAIRAKPKVHHGFLQFLIHRIVSEILSLTTGSTFPNVDSKSLRSIEVQIPTYKEQAVIARILDECDKEINLLRQKLVAYREQKKGLMQVLLTGKVRLNRNSKI